LATLDLLVVEDNNKMQRERKEKLHVCEILDASATLSCQSEGFPSLADLTQIQHVELPEYTIKQCMQCVI